MTHSPTPPRVDLPAEQRKILVQGALSAAVCLTLLLGGAVGLPIYLAFPTEWTDRIGFALRADLVVILWVLIAVRFVSRIRFVSAHDNAGSAYSSPSPQLAVRAAFLQNTLEQAVIAVVTLTALATVEGEAPLGYIVAAVVCFSLGRSTFLRGYHHGAGGRAFGMVTTVLPSLGAAGWTIAAMFADLWSALTAA